MKGTTKWFNKVKGFGFITGEDGKDYFVHFTSIKVDGFKKLADGQKVTFTPTEDDQGRFSALDVMPVE